MTALPRMSIAEMGEISMITRQVDMWGVGGDMRNLMGHDIVPPGSPLERAAIMAFDVALRTEPLGRWEKGADGLTGRDHLVELLNVGLRLAIVDERVSGDDGRTDVDRARQVLVSMALVDAMREHVVGIEPSELANPTLEAMRRKSGVEAGSFDRDDAHSVAMGMGDLVKGEEAGRQMGSAMRAALTPSVDHDLERGLEMADATWPEAVPRIAVQNAVPARSFDASASPVALQREASDRAARVAGR